jgi:hypothetical protein
MVTSPISATERPSLDQIKTVQDVHDFVRRKQYDQRLEELGYPDPLAGNKGLYRVAVGSLIFLPKDNDQVILIERGPKSQDAQGTLEGVGGGADFGRNLDDVVRNEIATEIGVREDEIQIDRVLDLPLLLFPVERKGRGRQGLQPWVVVSFLCRLDSGAPHVVEPQKVQAIWKIPRGELFVPAEQTDEQLFETTLRLSAGNLVAWPERQEPPGPLPQPRMLSPWTMVIRRRYWQEYQDRPYYGV